MKEKLNPIQNNNIIYGIRPIIEAIESKKTLDKIFIQKEIKSKLITQLKKTLIFNQISFFSVPIEKLNRLTRKNHQGAVAFISPIEFHSLPSVVQNSFESGKIPLLLILDKITDVRNFGSILRTAECCGVDAIIIPNKGSAAINEDTIKTSTGAIFKIPICKEFSLSRAASFLKKSGFQIVACTEKASDEIYSFNFTSPTVIILGSEQDGIQEDILKHVNKIIKIPMKGLITSLNVSVATGIILYEALRQRHYFKL